MDFEKSEKKIHINMRVQTKYAKTKNSLGKYYSVEHHGTKT